MRTGKILRDCSFDCLREEFLKVTLFSLNGQLPPELPFENIITCQKDDSQAVLTVQNISPQDLQAKAEDLNCQIEIASLPLEEIYKIDDSITLDIDTEDVNFRQKTHTLRDHIRHYLEKRKSQ